MPRNTTPRPDLTRLGERIRTRRTALGLSQQALARQAGVHRTAIHFWETGRVEPLALKLAAVAGALQVSVDSLVADEPAEPPR